MTFTIMINERKVEIPDTQKQLMLPEEFRQLGTEVTVSLADNMTERDETYLEYISYWKSMIPDWSQFISTAICSSEWGAIDKRAKVAADNARAQDQAADAARTIWGDAGK